MNHLDRFAEIARKWRCGSRFRDDLNPKGHDYAATYLRLLRNRPVRKILEIGLGPAGLFHAEQVAGAGVRMWSELFPDADVVGLDIRQDTLVNDGMIRSMLCDQSNLHQLLFAQTWVGYGVDLIVDDGSHRPIDQAMTAGVFMSLLSLDGVYVIEDVLPGGECSSLLAFPHKVFEFNAESILDDRLIVIERKSMCPN